MSTSLPVGLPDHQQQQRAPPGSAASPALAAAQPSSTAAARRYNGGGALTTRRSTAPAPVTSFQQMQQNSVVDRLRRIVGEVEEGMVAQAVVAAIGVTVHPSSVPKHTVARPPAHALPTKDDLDPRVRAQLEQCPALRLYPLRKYRHVLRLGRGAYGETWLVEALRIPANVIQQQQERQTQVVIDARRNAKKRRSGSISSPAGSMEASTAAARAASAPAALAVHEPMSTIRRPGGIAPIVTRRSTMAATAINCNPVSQTSRAVSNTNGGGSSSSGGSGGNNNNVRGNNSSGALSAGRHSVSTGSLASGSMMIMMADHNNNSSSNGGHDMRYPKNDSITSISSATGGLQQQQQQPGCRPSSLSDGVLGSGHVGGHATPHQHEGGFDDDPQFSAAAAGDGGGSENSSRSSSSGAANRGCTVRAGKRVNFSGLDTLAPSSGADAPGGAQPTVSPRSHDESENDTIKRATTAGTPPQHRRRGSASTSAPYGLLQSRLPDRRDMLEETVGNVLAGAAVNSGRLPTTSVGSRRSHQQQLTAQSRREYSAPPFSPLTLSRAVSGHDANFSVTPRALMPMPAGAVATSAPASAAASCYPLAHNNNNNNNNNNNGVGCGHMPDSSRACLVAMSGFVSANLTGCTTHNTMSSHNVIGGEATTTTTLGGVFGGGCAQSTECNMAATASSDTQPPPPPPLDSQTLPFAAAHNVSAFTSTAMTATGGVTNHPFQYFHNVPTPVIGAVSNLAATTSIRLKNGYEIAASDAFVCKIINSETSSFAQVANEVNILSNIAHPCIVAFQEGYVEPGHMNIVMEYVDGGDLRKEIDDRRSPPANQMAAASVAGASAMGAGPLFAHMNLSSSSNVRRYAPEQAVLALTVQLCLALEYLHRHNILHRDIKPDNIIVSKKWVVKLADFGLSRMCERDVSQGTGPASFVGTPGYVAAEVWQRRGCTEKTDMFGVGCVMYELIMLEKAYAAHAPAGPRQRAGGHNNHLNEPHPSLLKGEFKPIDRPDISNDLKHIVESLLLPNAEDRPSALQVLKRPCMIRAAKDLVRNYERGASARAGTVDQAWAECLRDQVAEIAATDCSTSLEWRQRYVQNVRQTRTMVAQRMTSTRCGLQKDLSSSVPTRHASLNQFMRNNTAAMTSANAAPPAAAAAAAPPQSSSSGNDKHSGK